MINLDYAKISDVEVDGIDTADYPDFVMRLSHMQNMMVEK